MSKQIKIGFDKIPAPDFPTFEPLYDIDRAVKLYDSAGNELVTPVEGPLASYNRMRNSTSISINNGYKSTTNENVKIEEQFAETSQVSSSLLGVPRAEVQLSLFADVSTYGYDVNTWDYYTFASPIYYPTEWYNRRNPIYGPRERVTFVENTDEQALTLRAYPVQYTFPFGPKWENSGQYNKLSFPKYLNFIATGKILYDYFYNSGVADPILAESLRQYAKNNFLSDNIKIVNSANVVLNGYDFDVDKTGNITGSADFYDVDYGENPQLAFDELERYTIIHNKLINEEAVFPINDSVTNDILITFKNGAASRLAGYTSISSYFGVLESKDVYRYQPGRISGFTFGIRANGDDSKANILEWGCYNSTDQYMLQIRGSEFNIVRRSTIPLGNEIVVNRLGLEEGSEKLLYSEGLDNATKLWETVIPRGKFNGDPLDGNGPSGYLVDLKKVTMFKIEFGWYGAIGARFYAYIPSENDQARWVVIHTLVIENGIGKPCLQNPEFKFRYYMGIKDTSTIEQPVYIYKYGASYYIDGGDEGTIKLFSTTSEPKDFTTDTPVIGIIPKKYIANSYGEKTKNQIISYPISMTARTDEPAKIEFTKINGSPEGFHYHYSPSLHNIKGAIREFSLVTNTSNYTNGTYGNIPLSGGSGSGAKANVTISGGTITEVSISDPGTRYNKNDLLFISTQYIGGSSNGKVLVSSVDESKSRKVTLKIIQNGTDVEINDTVILSINNGGSGYTDGTYYNVPLSGGLGSYATADVTVINGVVSYISTRNSGSGYDIDDILSFSNNIAGNGIGFSCKVLDIVDEHFNNSDYYRKIIANGVYNCYIYPNSAASESLQKTAKIARSNLYEQNERKILEDVILANGSLYSIYNIPFYATITGLNDTILKAKVPIKSNSFNIHFLNPLATSPLFGNKHYADFCIGLTEKELQIEEITNESLDVTDKKFVYDIDGVSNDFDMYNTLFVKWSHESEQLNINGQEIREWDPTYGWRMEIDPRLPSPDGVDSGRISKVVGNITLNNYKVLEIASHVETSQYKLYFNKNNAPAINENEIGYVTLGRNNEPTNIVFMSKLEDERVTVDEVEIQKFYIIVKDEAGEIASIIPNTDIQTKTVTMTDDFQIISYNTNDGSRRFDNKFFSYSQNIKFSSKDIYLVVGMNDDAKINGLVIEEINATQNITRNPEFDSNLIYEDTIFVNSGNSSSILTPSNFTQIERLSSSRIDTQTLQPLRPGVTVHSLYVSPNDSKPINLGKIFGRDRYKITSGLKNNTAIFITASSINGAGQIDISVNIKEQ